ncbi:NUDIX hydrolase [Gordonia sp. ABSL1-1]|uniref:NUDIX hydrolase n=1 Tax=Gordonia sp. ABSL1-1 TaxID=3053923 RepID=UPI00257422B2|nr:NUDIX hydrolase [Gordonia sp. ABSL1-1]MDL9935571.1 NUDIX hydrolase [Gordonia sp. ABSL1-1]
MSMSVKTIWAAGAVVWRRTDDGIEVAVVHRPRYHDWTLPKGKAEAGETLLDTAVREIAEETGYSVRLGRHLLDVGYDLEHSRKNVRYWAARAVSGEFVANREVDQLRWITVDEAAGLLSYRLDRKVLKEFNRLPADLHTMLLVRHAKAGRRSRYKGDDRLRPLEKAGRKQADALVNVLGAFGVDHLHAAERVRCHQTFEPAADHLALPIEGEPVFSDEAYEQAPELTQERALRLAADSDGIHAICSQGAVIPALMEWWADHHGVALPPNRNRKGSIWVLSLLDGRLMAADHIPSALPTAD